MQKWEHFFKKEILVQLMSPLGYRNNIMLCDNFVINGT